MERVSEGVEDVKSGVVAPVAGVVLMSPAGEMGSVGEKRMSELSGLPSPQCVGREFVRQYYTLLNQSPLHLHRFYSHNSSFIHGGLSDGEEEGPSLPVRGQQEIHEKIMQLNFRDCHAKIRQVDAHATLDCGVVIQVSGELSNGGNPMRRFMQTFVLAPQSPKKYYVHNDIFRYQDEVFSDEENETLDPSINLPDEENSISSYAKINTKVREENRKEISGILPSPDSLVNSDIQLNGSVIKELNSIALPDVTTSSSINQIIPNKDQGIMSHSTSAEKENSISTANTGTGSGDEDEICEESQSSDNSVSNGPLTYAKLVKSGPPVPPSIHGYSSSSGLPAGTFVKFKASSSPAVATSMPSSNESKEVSSIKVGASGSFRGGGGRGGGMVGRNSVTRERYSSSTRDVEDERPRGSPRLSTGQDRGPPSLPVCVGPFSDSQQLFVGNLPHNCSEADLQGLFGKFGKVLEIRINNKGASLTKTLPSGVRVPNYGFVVFEDENAVIECLKKKPIFLPEGNHRLNIEEKKVNKGRGEDIRNLQISSGNRTAVGSNFERSSQDLVSNRGINVSDRTVRGSTRPGSRNRGGIYSGHQGQNRGSGSTVGQLGQRGGYGRRS
uniref:Uncharacterized protein n=1 Tax=Lepeophtheirus salmonis TaxID=72036 RepID=A0A0K2U9F2_LEPSM